MFHLLWKWQYRGLIHRKDSFRRAAWVAVFPVAFVFGVVLVITNLAVTIQLAVAFASAAAVFASLLLIRDPSLAPGERDQRYLFPATFVAAAISAVAGLAVIMFVYASLDLPSVFPDHNLVASWKIDFEQLGYSREEAWQRLNLGYLWHAMCLFVYMLFVVGGRLLVDVYRLGSGDSVSRSAASRGQATAGQDAPAGEPLRRPLPLAPIWTFSKGLFSGKG